jgi:hypothetical protein
MVALATIAGCPDPAARFDDFISRVPDAKVEEPEPDAPPLEELPDVSGEFLVGVAPVVAPDATLRFISTNVMTMNGDGTATLDISLQPLRVNNGMPVGDPVALNDVPVSTSGTFTASFDDIFVEGEANPLTGSDIVADVILIGTIRNQDLYCGEVDGMVKQPSQLPLDGSTFGAIRVAPGTVGPDLPAPVVECPPLVTTDAGVPDGGGSPADAGSLPDAM